MPLKSSMQLQTSHNSTKIQYILRDNQTLLR